MSNSGSGEQLQEVVNRLEDEVAALRRSRRRLAEAGYAERRQIERTLHDGVQQHLVALAVNLQRLAGLVDDGPMAAKALLADIAADVREALDEAMELAHGIHPPLLEGLGLASELRFAAERAGVILLVEAPVVVGCPPEVIAAVYWSCVEALSSASRGSEATVSVHDADGLLTFDVAVVGRPVDRGMDLLRDRIEALDGGVSVDERQDGGSVVHGWLPLSR